MHHFKRIDYLFLGFVMITTILLLCSWNQTAGIVNLLIVRAIIFTVCLGFIYINPIIKSVLFNLLRNIYPLLFAGYFYTETVHYNKLFFNNLDPFFIKMDEWLFRFQPSIEFSKTFGNSWLTELMYFGYFSFYLIILGFVITLFFKRKTLFLDSVFKVTFTLLFFYFVFAVFPAAGPQFYFNEIDRVVPTNGYLFQKIMHAIQEGAEQPTGAFPSSHVGVTIVILLLARKKLPLFYKICFPLAFILVLSTVYIKAHYAVDVIFGLIIAPIILYLADFMYHYQSNNRIPTN